MPSLPERLEAIRGDRRSGAAELLRQAAETLEWVSAQPGFSEAALIAAGQGLIRAQPAMAPIVSLVNAVLYAGAARTAETCREFLRRTERAARAVAAEAARLIPDDAVVMSHSWSSTVLAALFAARESGRRFEVIATESRPLCEGAHLAKTLAAAGTPVRLIVDAAAYALLGEVDLVLVGADAVTVRGLTNKIGTAALALAARTLRVPVYALATTDKFLPAEYQPPPQEPREPAEVLAEQGAGLRAVNLYFDLSPLEYLTGIVTEAGVLGPGEMARRLAALRLHPALEK